MRLIACLFLLLFPLPDTPMSRAEPEQVITDFDYAVDQLLSVPLAEIRAAETLTVQELLDTDRKAVLSRLAALPKLTTLKFYSCNLSNVGENDPIPVTVKTVLISGGSVSQGTIRWLSKFPAGIEIVFGCDVRNLEFDLGSFTWVTFDNCELSRSAVTKLIEKLRQVTFKEVTLDGEK